MCNTKSLKNIEEALYAEPMFGKIYKKLITLTWPWEGELYG